MLDANTIVIINGSKFVQGGLGCGFVIVPEKIQAKLRKIVFRNFKPEWIIQTFMD
jgi:hypothetical protein